MQAYVTPSVPLSLHRTTFVCPSRRTNPSPHTLPSRVRFSMLVGILYSTVTGHTEQVADLVKQHLGDKADVPKEVADITAAALMSYDHLIVGAPTLMTDEIEQRTGTDWDEYMYKTLPDFDLTGKKVAVFGLGDAFGYGAYFCDAIEELHDCFASVGASMVGYVPVDGYEFDHSKSVRDDVFLGLPVDNANNPGETGHRVQEWVAQISAEMGI